MDSCRKYSSQKGDMGVTFSNDPSKSSQATSTLNIGTGYNIGLAMSLAGCSSCASENIEYLTVNAHAYSDYVAPDNDYYIITDPNTGYMIETKKDVTIHLWLDSA